MRNTSVHKKLQCQAESADSSSVKARLLLVEDHDVNQVLIQAMTKRLGYESELAADGSEAVGRVDQSIAQKNPFDLVLMDIQMPVMDGYEATRMIRASGISEETLPIIAITANAFGDDIRNCLAAGMQDHISKPINISNLESVLLRWLKPVNLEENRSPGTDAKNCLSGDLIERYRLRREEAISSITSLVRRGTFSNIEIREVSDQMHKLAGTAAMFGDKDLGDHAKLIEDGLKQWKIADRPQKIQLAVERFLEAA
mgnify:FL=1